METITLDSEYDTTTSDELDTLTYDELEDLDFDSYYELLDKATDEYDTYMEYEPTPTIYTTTTTTGSNDAAVTAAVTAIMGMMGVIVAISIVFAVYTAIVNFRISKKLGRSTAFAVLAIFFWPIMSGILAFGKNPTEAPKAQGSTSPAPEPVAPAVSSAQPAMPEAPAEPETPVDNSQTQIQ